jgi:hypothetical protein
MFLLCFRRETLTVPGQPEETSALMQEALVRGDLTGWMNGPRFRLLRKLYYKNPVETVCSGRIAATQGGSKLEVLYHLRPINAVVTAAFYIVTLGYILVHPSWKAPLALVLIHLLLCSGFQHESARSGAILLRVAEGR